VLVGRGIRLLSCHGTPSRGTCRICRGGAPFGGGRADLRSGGVAMMPRLSLRPPQQGVTGIRQWWFGPVVSRITGGSADDHDPVNWRAGGGPDAPFRPPPRYPAPPGGTGGDRRQR